ncbi:50S ribosomal protein L11 methyltransferase [Candidatus Peregrinibacteria bacterium]|nr:50S ribosomal protein L11 methyltransferase [Candidatus Peregrinibacteria bacterium]
MVVDIILFVIVVFLIALAITALVHIFFLVPYVPSKNKVVKKMVSAANLKAKETVYDLGCGDGRLLLEAEKKAFVKTVGFEIAPLVFLLAKLRTLFAQSKAQIKFQSFFKANLSKANVIFCYLIPNVMPRLASKIKRECKRGTRIISNTFSIPGLKLYKIFTKNPAKGMPTIYVYKI